MKILNPDPVIYVAYCRVSGKCYVGQTIRFGVRKARHLWMSSNGSMKHPKFYPALRLYGAGEFLWSVIKCTNIKELTQWENYWVEKMDSLNSGYNTLPPDQNYDDLVRKKLSIAGTGRRHTQLTKNKIAASRIGKLRSDEDRKRMSEGHQNRSPEDKAAFSKKMSERFIGPETRERNSAWQRGRVLPQSTREKIRIGNLGKKITDVSKQKMSAGIRAAWTPERKAAQAIRMRDWQASKKMKSCNCIDGVVESSPSTQTQQEA